MTEQGGFEQQHPSKTSDPTKERKQDEQKAPAPSRSTEHQPEKKQK
jgi:hypothetical protein